MEINWGYRLESLRKTCSNYKVQTLMSYNWLLIAQMLKGISISWDVIVLLYRQRVTCTHSVPIFFPCRLPSVSGDFLWQDVSSIYNNLYWHVTLNKRKILKWVNIIHGTTGAVSLVTGFDCHKETTENCRTVKTVSSFHCILFLPQFFLDHALPC